MNSSMVISPTEVETESNLASQIDAVCGRGFLLDVNCRSGSLVRILASRGFDAYGSSPCQEEVAAANRLAPGRFYHGTQAALPFPDHSFDTVFSSFSPDTREESEIAKAFAEFGRVTRRHLVLAVSSPKSRAYWEYQAFIAGFRKHPLSQLVVSYESLESETGSFLLLLEKIPAPAMAQCPLQKLQSERELHMDMLRESGRRADAHVARYMLARQYLPRQGVVLDAACGLGYGSALLAHSAPGVNVVGMDNSDFAVHYGDSNFTPHLPNLSFQTGDVCNLSAHADESVNLVVSFETVEHLREPAAFLTEVRRILKPGGRFICSVPNLWVDESGRDPNPWHFHVFDFPKLVGLVSEYFNLGDAYRQTAGGGMKLPKAPRQLRKVNLPVASSADEAEWWLLVAEKPVTPPATLVSQISDRKVVVMTNSPEHSVYKSWLPQCPFPVSFINPEEPGTKIPTDALLLVTHDTYREPSRSIIRQAVADNIPTLILADGVLDYRNTWEHPQIEAGAIFQPVLGHKIATIGRSQSRWLESWGNLGKCETVGLPRLDRHAGLARRQRRPNQAFRILISTAITPYFTEAHHEFVSASLRDLKYFFELTAEIDGTRLLPVWRLTRELDREIGVDCHISDLSGHEMAVALMDVDAVITTPSTALLEASFFGLPVAVLDFGNEPHYTPTAWRITAASQIRDVIAEFIQPPEAKLLFQETALHDSLECATPAAPRLVKLITAMVELGLECRNNNRPLSFPPQILHPDYQAAVSENRFNLDRLYQAKSTFEPSPAPKAASPVIEPPAAMPAPPPSPWSPVPHRPAQPFVIDFKAMQFIPASDSKSNQLTAA